ncbi:hypothetical protein Micbo1qcDRAFT_204850 [Microdochium bolleyi]|uniref:Rhodopsin domain-containing protein n=1 Tax=Microdochium bolleyi TaxID=196109 RepID=A0A136J196_9PEZI|nr:hypothetical protein Micbo1qcDRAFT_204850 [Microdochium bolleyi]
MASPFATTSIGMLLLRHELTARARPVEGMALEDRGPLILGTICAVTALSTFFSAGRLWVRGRLKGKLLLDDYLIAISVLCTWLTVVFQFLAVRSGNGRHIHTLTTEEQAGVAHWTIIGFVPGIVSFATPKLATIDLLCRILLPSRRHRIFLWVLGWTCWIQLMVTVVFLFVKCDGSHPALAVSRSPTKAGLENCLDPWVNINYDIYTGAFSAFVDFYLAAYPTIVLCKLRLSLEKKIGLSIALGFGFISTIVAVYKYDSSTLVIWTCVEGSTIIIAACIPILKPLLDYARAGCSQATASVRGGFSSRYRGTGRKGGTHGPQQDPDEDDAGDNLFRMGTRTGVVVVGPSTGGQTGTTKPQLGTRLKKPSFHNFSHHHHCDDAPRRGAPDKDGAAMCSTSSQDSILQRTRVSSEDAADTDISTARTIHEPAHAQKGGNYHQYEAPKRCNVEHDGIMRTDSVEITYRPASMCGAGGDHSTAV